MDDKVRNDTSMNYSIFQNRAVKL